jgi:choline/glycine/proline betaine transport protein
VNWANGNIVGNLGWYYVAIVAGFIIFALVVGISRLGDIKLGKDDDKPEFSTAAWLAMLFAAGMGIGLVFWGVAEPLNHLVSPRPGSATTLQEAGQSAMTTTLLHWGIHAWAIYVVVGLAIAYAVFRKGRPISIRWALEPLLGDRVKGWLGDVIDTVAVLGTVFGVATSLGLGAQQIGAGFVHMGWASDTGEGTAADGVLAAIIVVITLVAIVSVVSGLGRGIKWLSQVNVSLAAILALFVAIAGPTLFIIKQFFESIGHYLQNIVVWSFDVSNFYGDAGETFQTGWTIFYWGWWISWAPFVGIFIARISKGRTVREFVLGVLGVPLLVTIAWFAIMGGSAIYLELFGEGGIIQSGPDGPAVPAAETAFFGLLETLPASQFVIVGAIILIGLFFVTSSDSGSLVVDMLASGGDPNPPTWSRIFWASLEGAVAIVLLLAGGLIALQTGAIALAFPFSFVMVAMVAATWKALRAEHLATREADRLRRREQLAEDVVNQVTESFSDSVAEAVAIEAPPSGLTGTEHERAWARWWGRVIDRLKSRPGGFV